MPRKKPKLSKNAKLVIYTCTVMKYVFARESVVHGKREPFSISQCVKGLVPIVS